jgi:hypothetical protein
VLHVVGDLDEALQNGHFSNFVKKIVFFNNF